METAKPEDFIPADKALQEMGISEDDLKDVKWKSTSMWKVEYLRESLEDIKRLDQSQRVQVVKAINKVAVNPLPTT